MKIKFIIPSITLGLALLAMGPNAHAQWGGKKVTGNGEYTTMKRSVGDYGSVSLSGWFDLELVGGSEGELTLEGESNLLEHVVTEVKNGNLVIKTESGYELKPSNYGKGIRIVVPVEEISAVALSGSGDIISKTLLQAQEFSATMSGSGDIVLGVEAERLTATLSGSGDIVLSGKASNFRATISGSGDIKAYDLKASFAEATVAGSADIRLTVTEELVARVSGSGDIRYRGNPKKVDSKVAGSGDVEAE